jgi:hypothetical protein
MACVDRKPSSKGTSRKLLCPSAFPDSRAPFFTSPFEEAFGRLCPASRRFRPQGLATLSTACKLLDSLEISFNLQRSWTFPFGALLFLSGRLRVSPFPFAPALSSKTFRPWTGAPTICSHSEAVSLATPRFYVGARPSAPLGFGASQALPPLGPGKNRLLSCLPLPFFPLLNLTIEKNRNLRGSSPERLGSLPPKGAPACLAFPTDCVSHLLKR